MKIKQQSKSDIKGLVDDIKVNVIENVGTADICDRLNIAYLLKCLTVGHLNLVKSCHFAKDYFKSKTTDK